MSENEYDSGDEVADEGGPSEAELAMQRRKKPQGGSEADEEGRALLEENRKLREEMSAEISELKERSERRKKEREEEEKRLAEQRQKDEAQRKLDEEERKRKKEEEEEKRKLARADKMAQMEKCKDIGKPNFIITKKTGTGPAAAAEEDDEGKEKKSKEQLETEKRAILAQRLQPLDIDGFDQGKLADKAKELHKDIYRLEGEKYDLEKRFKEQQYDMMELAERARQMNKVGKGGLKRIQLGVDDEQVSLKLTRFRRNMHLLQVDKIQNQFAGAPAKIEMFSKYERQKDKRGYGERQVLFAGPVYGFPAERVTPWRKINWDPNTGLPSYEEIEGAARPDGEGEEEEEEE